MADQNSVPEGVDTTVPNAARMYDYALGGKNNFAVDRAAVKQLTDAGIPNPTVPNRAFLGRAVRFLAEAGIRQFLDLGSGLPTQGNVHEVAQEVDPDTHVVYVDYDPVAVAHGKALLSRADFVESVQADARTPEAVLNNDHVTRLIDFDQPIAILMVALLHVVSDEHDPPGFVARYRDAAAPGSYLAISHITTHDQPAEFFEAMKHVFERAREPMVPRSREEILQYFGGFELVQPGLVPAGDWRPDDDADPDPTSGLILAGVGRKN